MEQENVGGEKNVGNGMSSVLYCAIFSSPSSMHCFFGSRNSPTTGILHTFCHVYRSVCPAREAKLCFGAALECSVHDCKNLLLPTYQ